jgi:hypothetical protein
MADSVQERTVIGPAGGKFTVMTDEEERAWHDLVQRYTADNKFTNVSDLQDLERILQLEVLHSRYANWMSTESDYYGDNVDIRILGSTVKEFSGELRQLKKQIGIDRVSRSRDSAESLSEYIENLKLRAKEFGVTREKQVTKALLLFNDLMALMTLHDNTTPEEQRQQHCTTEDLLQWIREIAIPEYEEVDRYFVENQQKFWIADQ